MKRVIDVNNILIKYRKEVINLDISGSSKDNFIEEKDFDIPYYVLYVTDYCNLHCDYCFNSENNRRVFPYDKIRDLVDFFEENSQEFTLRFFGGEPLLCKQFIISVVEEINNRELLCHYNIFTNGVLLDNDMLDFFKRNKFTIFLSLPGSYREYSILENKYMLSKTINTIILKKIKLIGRIVWIPNETISLKELIYFGFINGIKIISFTLPWGNKIKINKDIFVRDLNNLVDDYIYQIKCNNLDYVGIHPFSSYVNSWINGNFSLDLCGIGKNLVSISTSGDLFPCHCMTNINAFNSGNIFDKYRIKKYENIHTYDLKECKKCDYTLFCKNKCLGNNYLTNNNILQISKERCFFEKNIIASSAYILNEIKKDNRNYKRFTYILKRGFLKYENSN